MFSAEVRFCSWRVSFVMEGSHCCSGDIMSLALAGGCGAPEGVEGEDPIGALCWNKRITAIPTSTWREMSGQEQQERMHVTERQW